MTVYMIIPPGEIVLLKKYKLWVAGEFRGAFGTEDEALEAMDEWMAWKDRKNLNFGDDVEYISGVALVCKVVASKMVLMNAKDRKDDRKG